MTENRRFASLAVMFTLSRTLCSAALALLTLAAGQAAPAQQAAPQPRSLEVPATASWQHAATQIILPSESAGLRRGTIHDFTADELDIVADYGNEAEGLGATVYLFRTSAPDAALWFDRALTAIRLRPGWGLADTPLSTVAPFVRPGGSVSSGLRTAFDVGTPEVRSTAVALAPLGDFLVKVRMSSTRLDAAALDAQLTRFLEGLRWPSPSADETTAVPIVDCPEPLRLRQARVVRDDSADVLMNLLTGIVMERAEGPPPVYCREPGADLQHGVYRPDASRNAYLIALGDSGIALSVSSGVEIEGVGGNSRRFSMRLLDRNAMSALPSFNRLPPPEQALAVAFGNRGPTISVTTSDREEH